MSDRAILMSIKPQYAEKIFDGTKTIELRRVCPKIKQGDLALIYVSGPRMALVGGFVVEGIVATTPSELCREYLNHSGVTNEVFMNYFKNSDLAYGILIGRTWEFEEAAELAALRRRKGGFQPPQSYRYLRHGEFKGMLG